jgi:ferrous iron transport protein A
MEQQKKWTDKTVADIPVGDTALVVGLPDDPDTKNRLLGLGITPGCYIVILKGTLNSPYHIQVNNSKIGLSWDIVKGIKVI